MSELFVRADEAIDGVYEFALDFPDSLASYDLSFYRTAHDVPVHLSVGWAQADSAVFSEDVWLPAGEVRSLYRSGVRPQNGEEWQLRVRVSEQPDAFAGIGLITVRHDGTR